MVVLTIGVSSSGLIIGSSPAIIAAPKRVIRFKIDGFSLLSKFDIDSQDNMSFRRFVLLALDVDWPTNKLLNTGVLSGKR